MKKIIAYVVAAALGIGLAVALFPSGPDFDVGDVGASGARRADGSVAASSDDGAGGGTRGRAWTRPGSEGIAGGSPAVDGPAGRGAERKTGPANPNPAAAQFEAWLEEPVARHAAVDSARWAHIAQVLNETHPDMAEEARAVMRELRSAMRPMSQEDIEALMMRERDFVGRLRESDAAELITDDLTVIEGGVSSALQGSTHPDDEPGQPPAERAADTGKAGGR